MSFDAASPSASRPSLESKQQMEDDLDPAKFLQSVRELSHQREREDSERYRKLEEEVEKGRQERLARRRDRARSITKDRAETPARPLASPLHTTPSAPNAIGAQPVTPPSKSTSTSTSSQQCIQQGAAMESSTNPPPPASPSGVPEFKGFGSMRRPNSSSSQQSSPQPTETPSSKPSPSAGVPTRQATNPWQRRPTSRPNGSRPLSTLARENSAHSRESSTDQQPEMSRDQIAASLGSRDPAWFRQTADRGTGNAAYRKSNEETGDGGESTATARRHLPGLSGTQPTRPESPARESMGSEKVDSARDSSWMSASRPTSGSVSGTGPSISDRASTTDSEQSSLGRTLTMSSSQACIATGADRPPSPTKGTGGFVQSAMMRRNDSVSKRWSAQPVGGFNLSRQNSTATNSSGVRSNFGSLREGGLQGSHSMPRLESTSRETSNEPISRPSSSSSNPTNLTIATNTSAADNGGFRKPALPPFHSSHTRTRSIADSYSTNAPTNQESGTSLPASPSKKLPNVLPSPTKTKSSWLESALTQPNQSPQASPTKEKEQPSWMANIAKAKEQRASVDLSRSSTPKYGGVEDGEITSRSGSPGKAMFGQGMLKRSESPVKGVVEQGKLMRSGSEARLEQGRLMRSGSQARPEGSESRDLRRGEAPGPRRDVTPPTKAKPKGLISRPTSLATSDTPFTLVSTPKAETPEVVPLTKMDAALDNEKKGVLESSNADKPASKPREAAPEIDQTAKPAPLSLKSTSKPDPPPALSSPFNAKPASPAPLNTTKPVPKPEAPPKKDLDFRSTLKSRPPPSLKPKDEPEFLNKFGALRKTQTQKYEAPDLLKDNILRGKSGLAVTGGPQKTVRKDEFKESLLAKKGEWQTAKEEGRPTQRTPSGKPMTPEKPEALGRVGSLKKSEEVPAKEKPREETPEALRRFGGLRQQEAPKPVMAMKPTIAPTPTPRPDSETLASPKVLPKPEKQTSLPTPTPSSSGPESSTELSRQTSAPIRSEPKQINETSKLASRFNPGLANILARGPPASSPEESRSSSPAMPKNSTSSFTPSEPPAEGGQLQDVRKGRAKGPKKRKGGAKAAEEEEKPVSSAVRNVDSTPVAKSPQLPAKSAAFRAVSATMSPKPTPEEKPAPVAASPIVGRTASPVEEKKAAMPKPLFASRRPEPQMDSKPTTPVKKPSISLAEPSPEKPSVPQKEAVPDFQGFGSINRGRPASKPDENKENTDAEAPSVKNVASFWSKSPATKPAQAPGQIQLPSRKDEEAAMRSAGFLARSPSRPNSKDGPGSISEKPVSSGGPPKPPKSSRIVSGQLKEASANKDLPQLPPQTPTQRSLHDTFGRLPRSTLPLQIKVQDLLDGTHAKETGQVPKVLRKTIVEYSPPDATPSKPPPQGEYTLFSNSAYCVASTFLLPNGKKAGSCTLWIGASASPQLIEAANANVRTIAREHNSGPPVPLAQWNEPASFFHTLGGLLITRLGFRTQPTNNKRFMLRGRKHLNHIAFDELATSSAELHPAFVYLISHPVSLTQTVLYLWKGALASTEEISAARLAAMDLSETGDVVEVDDGAEFASFLKIFGPGTRKTDLSRLTPGSVLAAKKAAPEKFQTRLFRLQRAEVRQTLSGGILGMFGRRPSGSAANNGSGAREDVKVEVKQIVPMTQSSFDPEGVYLLDAYGELFVLLGPLFASSAATAKAGEVDVLFSQLLLLAREYAVVVAGAEDRATMPKGTVVLPGAELPRDFGMLFRGWEMGRGLWGTGGLMAGSGMMGARGRRKESEGLLGLEDVIGAVCRE